VIPLPDSPARIVLTPDPEARFPFLRSLLPESCVFIGEGKKETEKKSREIRLRDIFRAEGEKLLRSGKLSPQQGKAVYSIMHCRTEVYGYHADVCGECGFTEVAYNSCRNRHCPQCQGTAKRRWVNRRIRELLPVPYHHVVFTVPSYISMLSLYSQKVIYGLLFQAVAQTLLCFGKDPKHLGAEPGFYGILHTWSQTLTPHIHIHIIITAGGLTEDGIWKEKKHGKKFLFPVRALSKVFRGKFIQGLKELYYKNELNIPDSMDELCTPEGFEKQVNTLVKQSWKVYSKPPFSGPEEAVRYIGRYTHRTAVSDSRIRRFENGEVTFPYRDSREKDPEKKYKEMTLSSEEFIRRFLYHILPSGYHRIRNFGFLSNGRKFQNIEIIRKQLPDAEEPPMTGEEEDEGITCPVCGKGKMRTFLTTDMHGRLRISDPDISVTVHRDTS
jgi:ssDNA-binding Zn-finger/Zn-ribbon topoisomerase 1